MAEMGHSLVEGASLPVVAPSVAPYPATDHHIVAEEASCHSSDASSYCSSSYWAVVASACLVVASYLAVVACYAAACPSVVGVDPSSAVGQASCLHPSVGVGTPWTGVARTYGEA